MTDQKKWYSGSDGYKWLGKELLGLSKVGGLSYDLRVFAYFTHWGA